MPQKSTVPHRQHLILGLATKLQDSNREEQNIDTFYAMPKHANA